MNKSYEPRQLFYQNKKAHSVVTKEITQSIVRGMNVPLATLNPSRPAENAIMAVSSDDSIQTASTQHVEQMLSYSVYGFSALAASALIDFTGEIFDSNVSGYLLGNGYRIYRPDLMRLTSPDNIAPFTVLNSYSYCAGDPVNYTDPSGHHPFPVNPTVGQRVWNKTKYAKTWKAKENALGTLQKMSDLNKKIKNHQTRKQEINSRLADIASEISTGDGYSSGSAMRAISNLKDERKQLLNERANLPAYDPAKEKLQAELNLLESDFASQMQSMGLTNDEYGISQLSVPNPMNVRSHIPIYRTKNGGHHVDTLKRTRKKHRLQTGHIDVLY